MKSAVKNLGQNLAEKRQNMIERRKRVKDKIRMRFTSLTNKNRARNEALKGGTLGEEEFRRSTAHCGGETMPERSMELELELLQDDSQGDLMMSPGGTPRQPKRDFGDLVLAAIESNSNFDFDFDPSEEIKEEAPPKEEQQEKEEEITPQEEEEEEPPPPPEPKPEEEEKVEPPPPPPVRQAPPPPTTFEDVVENMIYRLLNSIPERPELAPTWGCDLTADEILCICHAATELHLQEPMLPHVPCPTQICGDLHGQYFDLLRIFERVGYPPHRSYLFLGDYVDRGRHSIETICLLLCFKIMHPQHIYLLRGNHESSIVNMVYGFYQDCKMRYSIKVYRAFCNVFNALPVAALVEERILCMHGGISPRLMEVDSLDVINDISRPTEVPNDGLMADLLWADPSPGTQGFVPNTDRGIAHLFGEDALAEFLQKHDLDLVIRAHQVVEDGYEFFADRQLVTIFSAPNYCGEFDNAGGVLVADDELMLSFEIFPPSGGTLVDLPQEEEVQQQQSLQQEQEDQYSEDSQVVSDDDSYDDNPYYS